MVQLWSTVHEIVRSGLSGMAPPRDAIAHRIRPPPFIDERASRQLPDAIATFKPIQIAASAKPRRSLPASLQLLARYDVAFAPGGVSGDFDPDIAQDVHPPGRRNLRRLQGLGEGSAGHGRCAPHVQDSVVVDTGAEQPAIEPIHTPGDTVQDVPDRILVDQGLQLGIHVGHVDQVIAIAARAACISRPE